jgi:tRNA(adenine34) deaminase
MNPFLAMAIAEAEAAGERGEVPVGAVVVKAGIVLARDGNRVEELADVTAHAEILVLRAAARALAQSRLDGCDLWVTLEPCPMCAAAISLARVRRLYFGAYDPKSGGVDHGPHVFDHGTCHHRPEVVGGLEEHRTGELLRTFFRRRR